MKTSSKIILLTVLVGFLIVLDMFVEPYWIETKEVVIESNDIPPQFDGKKIVFLTDIHYGPFFSKDRVDNLVKQTNALNPDLVVLGGDYVDYESIKGSNESNYVKEVFQSLSGLKAPLGVYAVLGNNDPQDLTLYTISQSNVTYIGNKGTWIESNGGRIRLGGVGDYNNGNQIQSATTNGVLPTDFVILLSHNPDYFPKVDKNIVDLVLSGHTHGGQVTIFGLWAPDFQSRYKAEYRTGVMKYNNTTLLVSNGLGTVTMPIRFFARPQIILIKLKRI
jgi:predicted MPP superfamily phosphohydrolase